MMYKWSTETFRKKETLSTGESHEYSGERYWIDIANAEGIKLDVVLKRVTCDNKAPIINGCFRVNEMAVKYWEASSFNEAADIGEKLIEELKSSMSNITY